MTPKKGADKPQNKFPIRCLPHQLARLIDAVQKETDLPLDYFGGSALSLLSYFVGNRFRLRVDSDHFPANIYTVLVGAVGTGKSTVIDFMLSPIWEKQINMQKNNDNKVVILKNVTVKELQKLLNKNPFGILYLRNEIANLLGEGAKDKNFLLDAWNNTYTDIHDKRGSLFIERPFVNIVGELQYERLAFMAEGGKLSSGLFNHFLFCLSENKKMVMTRETLDSGYSDELRRICGILEEIPSKIERNEKNYDINSYEVELNLDSFKLFRDFEDEIKTEAETIGISSIREGIGRLAEYTLRIALVLHIAETMLSYSEKDGISKWNPSIENQLQVDTMGRAIEIARYFKQNFDIVTNITRGNNQGQITSSCSLNKWQEALYHDLPYEGVGFKRLEAIVSLHEISKKLGISVSDRTLSRFLKNENLFTKSNGRFTKKQK